MENIIIMGNRWYLTLLGLASLLAGFSCCEAQTVCQTPGWFGSSCQYKCHCTNDNCDSGSGECTSGSLCINGWFGPACQYVDLTFTNSTLATPAWLSDGNDSTCNPDMSSISVTVTLTSSFPVTWLRLHVINPDSLERIQYDCAGGKTALVNDNTLDLHCDFNENVSQVVLNGDGVADLCSVYISGGRNVALKQQTQQTSTYSDSQNNPVSSKAVDGYTDGNYYSGSCSHTSREEHPKWSVSFTQPMMVNRYVLYNRLDNELCRNCRERLQGFILTSFASNGQQVFSYQDKDTVPHNVYTVISPSFTLLVSHVNITATFNEPGVGVILTLCEVEIYGDSVCPSGMYGRECEARCNCAGGSECLVTGGCPAGCAIGYHGETCNEPCLDSHYGVNCKETCSTNCVDQKCNSVSGDCDECRAGRKGKQCAEECDPKTWGGKCEQDCSTICLNQLCEATTGVCLKCPPGTLGPQCDELCEAGKYGKDCSEECSPNCNRNGTGPGQSLCDHVSGACIGGCQNGYQDPLCVTLPEKEDSSEDQTGLVTGLGVGIAILAVILVVVVVVSVYCYRQRLRAARESGQRRHPGHDDVDMTRQDDHIFYRNVNRAENDNDLPRNATNEDAVGNQDKRTKSTASYANADVGHYEFLTADDTKEDEYEQIVQNQPAVLSEGKDNNGYVNLKA